MLGFLIKLSGAGFVLAGAGLFGHHYRKALGRKTVITEATLKTLRMMREKILHENELLELCMASCGKLYPLPEGNLFEGFTSSFEEGGDLPARWKEHVTQYLKKNGISSVTLEQGLWELGEAFSHVSTESLISAIDETCTLLEEERSQAEIRQKKEGPLAWKISMAIGVLLVVILY